MVSSRKVLAYLLTFTLLALGLPTANAAEETLVGEKVATNAGEASLTVRIDSPVSKFDAAKQYTLPRNGLTLLPSVESKYASGPDLFNLYKSDGLYSYAPVANKAELGRFRKFNGLEFGYPAASPRSMFPQDTTQAPQQQPSPEPKSRVGKVLAIVGIALMGEGGVTIALAPNLAADSYDSGCDEACYRSIGGISLAVGAVLTAIGISKW